MVVQWTCRLPRWVFKQGCVCFFPCLPMLTQPSLCTHWNRNFKHNKKLYQKGKRRKKQNTLQPVRATDAPQVSNINCYVTQMLAASLGLKLFDITRRILMYTKETDDYKHIYAIIRGTFPIHELCGTMTILLLARRDVLGVNLPMWKILGPAVFIHAMANFRGMKVSCILCLLTINWNAIITPSNTNHMILSLYSSGTVQHHGPRCR